LALQIHIQLQSDAYSFQFATYFAVDMVMLFFSSVDKGPVPHIYTPHHLRNFHDRTPLGKKLQSLVSGYEEHVIENK
jgi:hypothetical protein